MIVFSDDVEKHPYSYLEELFKPDVSPFLFYCFGPHLMMTCDIDKYVDKVNYKENPLLKMLLDVTQIVKVFQNTQLSAASTKAFLVNKLRTLPVLADNDTCTPQFYVKYTCEICLAKIINHQRANHLMESAILNYSPIYPYTGSLSNPSININGDDNLKKAIEILSKDDVGISLSIQSLLIQHMDDILVDHNMFIRNSNHNNQYNITDKDDSKKLPAGILNMISPGYSFNVSSIYFFVVYIYYMCNRSEYSDIFNIIASIKQASGGGGSYANVTEMMNIMSRFDLPAIESSIFDEDIVLNMEYEQDKKIEKLMSLANIDIDESATPKYNLDKLTSYIYNAERYKTDSYTNGLFLNKNKSVAGYSYIKYDQGTMMVCEIDDAMLAIPVIDLADNYKMKMVCMDKEGNITVNVNFNTRDD